MRERAAMALDRIRRAGATTLLVSHEEDLIRRLADEVWWLHQGKLAGRGDPEEVLAAYRKHIAEQTARLGREHHAAAGAHGAPRRRARRRSCASRRSARTASPPWCGAAASWRWCGGGALPRCGGRPGDRHHDPHAHRAECLRHQHGTGTVEARTLRAGQYAGTDIRVLLRALPGGVHAHGGVARSRWRLARLAGGRGLVHGERLALHGGSGESARAGESAGTRARYALRASARPSLISNRG